MGRTATINPDGTFTVSGLESGLAYISLGNRDGSDVKGLAVARVVKDGIIQQRGLEIKTGETITDVQVIVSYGTGAVHGTVRLTKGTIVPNTRFWVQIARLDGTNIGISPPAVDARGQFLMEGLCSGTYVFTIHMYDSSGKLVSRIKQQVNVADGNTSEIIFPIDPDAPPTPNQ